MGASAVVLLLPPSFLDGSLAPAGFLPDGLLLGVDPTLRGGISADCCLGALDEGQLKVLWQRSCSTESHWRVHMILTCNNRYSRRRNHCAYRVKCMRMCVSRVLNGREIGWSDAVDVKCNAASKLRSSCSFARSRCFRCRCYMEVVCVAKEVLRKSYMFLFHTI